MEIKTELIIDKIEIRDNCSRVNLVLLSNIDGFIDDPKIKVEISNFPQDKIYLLNNKSVIINLQFNEQSDGNTFYVPV